MTILNTTFIIERNLETEFTEWLRNVYVPAASASGTFASSRLARVISNEDPMAVSIACELKAESLSEAVKWHDVTAALLRDDMNARWGERALFFSTYLKEI